MGLIACLRRVSACLELRWRVAERSQLVGRESLAHLSDREAELLAVQGQDLDSRVKSSRVESSRVRSSRVASRHVTSRHIESSQGWHTCLLHEERAHIHMCMPMTTHAYLFSTDSLQVESRRAAIRPCTHTCMCTYVRGCMWMHVDACGCMWMHVHACACMWMHLCSAQRLKRTTPEP